VQLAAQHWLQGKSSWAVNSRSAGHPGMPSIFEPHFSSWRSILLEQLFVFSNDFDRTVF